MTACDAWYLAVNTDGLIFVSVVGSFRRATASVSGPNPGCPWSDPDDRPADFERAHPDASGRGGFRAKPARAAGLSGGGGQSPNGDGRSGSREPSGLRRAVLRRLIAPKRPVPGTASAPAARGSPSSAVCLWVGYAYQLHPLTTAADVLLQREADARAVGLPFHQVRLQRSSVLCLDATGKTSLGTVTLASVAMTLPRSSASPS